MNRTSVLILQHRRERFHPFNTARIVHQALDRCQLMSGFTGELNDRFESLSLCPNAGLLFPGDDAPLLTQLPTDAWPQQLVIPDGTWHHVKTLLRDVPRLRSLPRYRLAPESPSRYRIRREPHADGLSTLEATVTALKTLEPETDGLDRLLDSFDRMIAGQLRHGHSQWRENQRRRSGTPNVPRILTGDLSNIVVAYGEREQGNPQVSSQDGKKCQPSPVYWTAVRMVSGEVFQCAINSESLRDAEFLKHLRLAPQVIETSVSASAFRARWKTFLRPDDHVAVTHSSTARLLANVDAQFSPTLILKSINVKPPLPVIAGLPNVARMHVQHDGDSRASQRLASAVAFVEHLNQQYGRSDGRGRRHASA